MHHTGPGLLAPLAVGILLVASIARDSSAQSGDRTASAGRHGLQAEIYAGVGLLQELDPWSALPNAARDDRLGNDWVLWKLYERLEGYVGFTLLPHPRLAIAVEYLVSNREDFTVDTGTSAYYLDCSYWSGICSDDFTKIRFGIDRDVTGIETLVLWRLRPDSNPEWRVGLGIGRYVLRTYVFDSTGGLFDDVGLEYRSDPGGDFVRLAPVAGLGALIHFGRLLLAADVRWRPVATATVGPVSIRYQTAPNEYTTYDAVRTGVGVGAVSARIGIGFRIGPR